MSPRVDPNHAIQVNHRGSSGSVEARLLQTAPLACVYPPLKTQILLPAFALPTQPTADPLATTSPRHSVCSGRFCLTAAHGFLFFLLYILESQW
jgi:hypothetical protein